MNHVLHLFSLGDLPFFLVIGGFLNLFGGDKKTENVTTSNTSVDASKTTTDSNNVSDWLQQNLAQIKNSTRIQNTDIRTTDSYNRTTFSVMSDVGNINPGQSVSPALDSAGIAAIFNSVLSHPISGITPNSIAADPNADPMDFAGISRIGVQTIQASGGVLGDFYKGVTDLTKVSSPTSAVNNPNANPLNSPWFWPVAAVITVVFIFFAFRGRGGK